MKLDTYLDKVGMRDTELARRCGVNRSRISRIRRELERPGWELAAKIKRATGGEVTADDFLPDLPDAPPQPDPTAPPERRRAS